MGMAPHSPLHCLGGHQEGHEVSPFQLLSSHEGTPNKQGAQDHACMVKGADGEGGSSGSRGQSLARVLAPRFRPCCASN